MLVYIDDLVSAEVVVVVVVVAAGDIVRGGCESWAGVVSALAWTICCWVEEMRMSLVPGGNVGDLWGGGCSSIVWAAENLHCFPGQIPAAVSETDIPPLDRS